MIGNCISNRKYRREVDPFNMAEFGGPKEANVSENALRQRTANAFLGIVLFIFKFNVFLILCLGDKNQVLYSTSLSIATTFLSIP